MAAPDLIIPEVDHIRLASHVLEQLSNANLLERLARRTVSINGIRSTQGNQVFGGGGPAKLHNFAKTASSVARMCFLEAGNVDKSCWPAVTEEVSTHNTGNWMARANTPDPLPPHLKFTEHRNIGQDRDLTSRYSSRYDQLNPYSVIKHNFSIGLRGVQNQSSQWDNKMFVFVFAAEQTDIAEFTTLFHIRAGNPATGLFQCDISVCYTLYRAQASPLIEQMRPLRLLRHPEEYTVQHRPQPQAADDQPGEQSENEESGNEDETEQVQQQADSSVDMLAETVGQVHIQD